MTGEIILLKGHNPARTHRVDQLAQHGLRVGQMHHNEPADQGVERLLQCQRAQVGGQEGNLRKASRLHARLGHLEHVGTSIDPEHTACLAYQDGGFSGIFALTLQATLIRLWA